MKRIIALLVVVVVAGLFAWRFGVPRDAGGTEVSALVERQLRAGEFEAAQLAVDQARGHVPKRIARYLDALLQCAVANQLDPKTHAEQIRECDRLASEAAEEAYADGPEAKDDWRVASMVVVTRIRAGRLEDAWEVLDRFVKDHPADERALAGAADYWVRIRRDAPDPSLALEYIRRIDALTTRTVPDTDPTALSKEFLARTRATAEAMRGNAAAAVVASEARVKAAPEDASAWAQLGLAQLLAKRPTEAIAAFRKAVSLDPASDNHTGNLVLLLFDDPDAAPELMRLTEVLLKRHPGDPQMLILRARAFVRNQDYLQALAQAARKPFEANVAEGYAEAIEIYQGLLARSPPLPPEILREVERNIAVSYYDWKVGGEEGEYLAKSYEHLQRYQQLGGAIDGKLQAVWEKLETSYGRKHPGNR